MADISKDKKIEIEKIVKSIISNIDISVLPSIDIVSLVRNDGFLVRIANMPLNITGYLIVNENEYINNNNKTHRLIVVNKKF